MDGSHSPKPSDEGKEQAQAESGDTPSRRGPAWLIEKLLKRRAPPRPATPEAVQAAAEQALGPFFDRSSAAERAMVMNILRLRELRVVDVMIPRADVVAVSDEASLEDVVEALQRGQLSRVPVYNETLDDPIGFVHLKDLALTYGVGCSKNGKEFVLRDHVRRALFVPPSMRIAALLQRMQASRVHMALVIDEFGGVDGLVTIEDLVEQIVGDIEDEHDIDEASHWREEAPGVFLVDARADIQEFEEAENVRLLPGDWGEDIDTMGGLVFMLTGRVPARGEVITHPMGHEFEVSDADPRRIRRLRLTLNTALSANPAMKAAAE